jgi:hypothetical protein
MEQAILNALCEEDSDELLAVPKASLKEQIDFIAKNINFLGFNAKKQIIKIPTLRGYKDKITDCNEGIALVMDLPESIIEEMYKLTYFELSRL